VVFCQEWDIDAFLEARTGSSGVIANLYPPDVDDEGHADAGGGHHDAL
jgi:hypothetical protein